MASHSIDTKARGWRALREWLLGPSPGPDVVRGQAEAASNLPARIGHYTIVRQLGQGGMGVVYAARDERLERTVALKMLSLVDDTARQRFWREARAAASVNHPNVCQIHEIGEDGGSLFISMELLEGESLADRLRRGPLTVSDALPIALGMLAALSALHNRGLVHRDLKPSNVFLTPHGVKLLDFGLARLEEATWRKPEVALTQSGVVVGTPHYMAPEQAMGESVDARSDLFAAAAVLFEMLAGRPAFVGNTIVAVLHATVHEQPPALTGSPSVAAVDRIIRRALAKRPDARFASADEFAEELRALRIDSGDSRALARALTRVVVLPFRVLRPDPETDFLAFSLSDAISTSLSRVGSLVVRSSAAAARFAGDAPDLKLLASAADVDRVVMGTLLRAGDQVRATAQLVEAPGGTLLTSHAIDSTMGDLFALQDDIARRVVAALSPPLAGNVMSQVSEAPHDARAYELYLRANEMARTYGTLSQARDLYERALELDPRFALAWAHLGRCHRVIGKFVESSPDSEQRAKEAFDRALALDPHLSVAHKFYASLESDMGQGPQAIVRLLSEATRHGNDPELFAGLVQACRYSGLFDEAIAAHAEARRLDPNVTTSLYQTLLMAGDLERMLSESTPVGGGDQGIRVMGLGLAGRHDEARQFLLEVRQQLALPAFQAWADFLTAWLDRRIDRMKLSAPVGRLKILEDPEANFLQGWLLCEAGAHDEGLVYIQRAVRTGYFAVPTLARSRHFDPVRFDADFRSVLDEAEAGQRRALAAFREAGGERLLGRQAVRAA